MSTTVMAACWPLQLPPTPKAVLISLADNASDHGACWPSLSTICQRTCFGRTAVIEAVRYLEDNGYLVADRSNGRHTKYQIVPKLDLFEPAKPVRQADQSGKRTGAAGEPHRSASRTKPVRQADTNHQEPSKAKNNSAGTRGTRLPDGWVPSPELKAWVKQEHPTIDIGKVAKAFVDYWVGVPGARGLKLDWDATFRNRVRDVEDKRPVQTTPKPVGKYVKPPRETPEQAFEAERKIYAQMLEYGTCTRAEHDSKVEEARQRMNKARAGPAKKPPP